jgi:hypothetical protein
MKNNIKHFCFALIVMAAFTAMALACATPQQSYHSKPAPCVKHKPLTYSPVLVTIYISGSYNMKDLKEVQRTLPHTLLDKMNALSYGKYQMADGVKPNLSLYITYSTDSYEHYGAEIKGYVYDGDFYYTMPSNYITFDRLDTDIVSKVNGFITGGWCTNCPSPCDPYSDPPTGTSTKKKKK